MIIFNESLNDHLKTLALFFSEICDLNLKINKARCIFGQKKISFFGIEISESGINADPNKTDFLRRAVPPQNVNELRSFLGLCTYVSKFIPNFSDRAVALQK